MLLDGLAAVRGPLTGVFMTLVAGLNSRSKCHLSLSILHGFKIVSSTTSLGKHSSKNNADAIGLHIFWRHR